MFMRSSGAYEHIKIEDRMLKRVLLSWSSGKDSAWSLYHLSKMPDVQVAGLLTTFNQAFDRVAMHAVRRTLVEAQADAAGIPLRAVPLPWPCSNQEYERIMSEVCQATVAQGIDAIAFGDLFLADIRAYRERQLSGTGLEAIFPLWQIPTDVLAREMIGSGLRARLTCVDPRVLPRDFAGREFDLKLLDELPPGVDPCGENGEFHSFAYAGPMFHKSVPISTGEIVERDGFVFADLVGHHIK
jgi:uncharacterized protein (TIGR00290 family)